MSAERRFRWGRPPDWWRPKSSRMDMCMIDVEHGALRPFDTIRLAFRRAAVECSSAGFTDEGAKFFFLRQRLRISTRKHFVRHRVVFAELKRGVRAHLVFRGRRSRCGSGSNLVSSRSATPESRRPSFCRTLADAPLRGSNF